MVYQGFKFIFVRMGVVVMLVITCGYGVLFALHEVFFQGMQVDDSVLKWSLLGTSMVVGFIAFGFIGDWRFANALAGLREIDIKAGREGVTHRFENLIDFTRSSYFWPGTGKRLRQRALREYAEYLLATGVEDSEAQRIFLQAFLRDPEDKRFRDVMVSSLTRKVDPSSKEIDILLLILQAQHYEDKPLVEFLANYFLEQDLFTHKSEPVFRKALELKTGAHKKIARFMLPILLAKKKNDTHTIEFYLYALPEANPEQKEKLMEMIGYCYAEKRFETGDPVLHQKCGEVFSELNPRVRGALIDRAEESRLGGKWKRVRLFTSEDQKVLKELLVKTGIVKPWGRYIREFFSWVFNSILLGLKALVLKAMDGVHQLGGQPTRVKFGVFGFAVFLFLVGAAMVDWQLKTPEPLPDESEGVEWEQKATPKPVPSADNRTYTIQVAAVTTQAKADKLIKAIQRNSIDGAYILKVERKKGGYWYKIRVGTFDTKDQARSIADRMVQLRLIRNYFLIAIKQPAKSS
ncbi:MAG: SPOR domain-containing protein [Candidatus Nitronauta litoralis]|uniref:SPOR domain-containing protein n=1 Tax=Candidatus Nitronauta litoralis TaxID=2705533 RepID=A0A7T0G1Q0_9BACT|nr:MAG: SPOR domain-containing protein [Candidatus Nitronauta litoralis]